MQSVGFPIILGDPEAVLFGDRVGTSRIERRCLALRNLLHLSIEFRSGGLVEAGIDSGFLDRVEQPQRAERVGFGGVFGNFEAHLNMALCAEIVDFGGMNFFNQPVQVRGVGQVAVVQKEPYPLEMRILVQVVDSTGVESAGAPDEPVYLVTLFQ